MKAKYQKGGRKAERVQNRKDAKANRKKFKKFGTPLNKKSINSFRQKGGEVKRSLKYKPGFPTTGDKPSPYDLKTLKKAIARDSTTVADRGMIGDFFDPGVTSGSTGPSDQYNLQINREYRDKVTGADSEQTAKKINKMKKQTGGPYTREQRKAVKKSGKAMKKHGRKLKRAGSQNKMAGFEKEGDAQIEAGMAFKKEGRNRKKMSRKMRDDNFIIENKELVFGKPSKKRPTGKDPDDYGKGANPRRKVGPMKIQKGMKMQKGGRFLQGFFENDAEREERLDKMSSDYFKDLERDDKAKKAAVAKAKKNKADAAKSAASAKSAGATWRTAVGAERPSGGDKEAKMKLAIAQDRKVNYNKSKPDYPLRKQKGGMKYGKGGMKDKKFLGGLAGAIGGAKGGGGLKGMLKGAMGGGMLGRGIGAIKGAMGGGGLKGAMQGFKGGAFGNSNPMAQQQAQGADPAMAQQAAAAPAAQDPAMQDPAAQQMAQRGGLRKIKNTLKGRRITKARSQSNKNKKKAFNRGTNRRGNRGMRG
jgi:hypothetical protein